jgi:hypothetical protein
MWRMDEQTNQDQKKILDETDLERSYCLSKPWQRKRRRLGDGPPFLRINRMIRYRREDVESWLAKHRVVTD